MEQSAPVHPVGQLHRSEPSHTPPFSHTNEHTADTARMAWLPASATYKYRWEGAGGVGMEKGYRHGQHDETTRVTARFPVSSRPVRVWTEYKHRGNDGFGILPRFLAHLVR